MTTDKNTGKTISVSFKIAKVMVDAIDKSVEESPLEFKNRSDFVKRAIERELRVRGKIKTYKD